MTPLQSLDPQYGRIHAWSEPADDFLWTLEQGSLAEPQHTADINDAQVTHQCLGPIINQGIFIHLISGWPTRLVARRQQ